MNNGIQRATTSYTTTRWSDQYSPLVGLIAAILLLAGLVWMVDTGSMRATASRLLVGLVGSLSVGTLAMRRGWLRPSGRLGAVLVGTLTLGFGGLAWGALLIAFFALSSLLSRLGRDAQADTTVVAVKGARRDLGQVLANGGLAALLAVASWVWPSPCWSFAFLGAIAAVTADTWSTEIGARSLHPPRLITTGQPVPRGTNGGITLVGTLGGAAGALTIGLIASLFVMTGGLPEAETRPWLPLVLGLAGGLVGGAADSLLGATLQAARLCPVCGVETEHSYHRCGTPTRPLRGWPWLDNDRVNFLASAAGAVTSVGIISLF